MQKRPDEWRGPTFEETAAFLTTALAGLAFVVEVARRTNVGRHWVSLRPAWAVAWIVAWFVWWSPRHAASGGLFWLSPIWLLALIPCVLFGAAALHRQAWTVARRHRHVHRFYMGDSVVDNADEDRLGEFRSNLFVSMLAVLANPPLGTLLLASSLASRFGVWLALRREEEEVLRMRDQQWDAERLSNHWDR